MKQIKLDEILWEHDANSLYPSAIWDENSIYPRIENGDSYAIYMNDELVQKFNASNFILDSAILKIKYYFPKILIVQHLAVKEREKRVEINCMRNGCIIDTLTSVDIQEIVKIGER